MTSNIDDDPIPPQDDPGGQNPGQASSGDGGVNDNTIDDNQHVQDQPVKTPQEEREEREFLLYLGMCKTLTLQLPFERDRVIASKWVKKIETSEEDIPHRLNYLKLLCVSMFSHRLAGPFKGVPNQDGELDDLGDLTKKDIVDDMVQQSLTFETSPYYVEMSGDLKEYAAYQEIPNFGAHFYYAFSNETILNWRNEKRAIIPTGGLNYPILDPPPKHITKTAEAFKKSYKQYANPEPAADIPNDALPNLMTELKKRKVVTKEDISRMGTKKLIGPPCKCQHDAPELPPIVCKKTQLKPAGTGRPASCGTKQRPSSCAAARAAK